MPANQKSTSKLDSCFHVQGNFIHIIITLASISFPVHIPKIVAHDGCWQEQGVPCPQFFSSKGKQSVEKEMQGNDSRVQWEIGVKTRKVGGGRQLREVARRLDMEVEQKQKVNFFVCCTKTSRDAANFVSALGFQL